MLDSPEPLVRIPWLWLFGLTLGLLAYFGKLVIGLIEKTLSKQIETLDAVVKDLTSIKVDLTHISKSLEDVKKHTYHQDIDITQLKMDIQKIIAEQTFIKERLQE